MRKRSLYAVRVEKEIRRDIGLDIEYDMRLYAAICGYIRRYAAICGDMRRYAAICGDMRL